MVNVNYPLLKWWAFHRMVDIMHSTIQTNRIWTDRGVYDPLTLGNLDNFYPLREQCIVHWFKELKSYRRWKCQFLPRLKPWVSLAQLS